ncbi:MAG: ABC transporter permease [Saprospiraceae bacterium]|nr:ABC transporter permease [Saprospiraceae bacterium]
MKYILKYSFYEMVRSKWAYIYTGFYLCVTFALYLLSNDLDKTLISLSNITLALTPLIGILFGTSYYYSSKEFLQLLLSQPISRWHLFLGMYGGMAITLCVSILIGIGLPLISFGILSSASVNLFLLLMTMACTLSVIFSLIAFLIAMQFDDKVKGLSISIFIWLFFAILYDGFTLLLLFLFKDYPLDKFTIGAVITNPIDLARILITMNLDVSAMMGYTGAVMSKFLGKGIGMVVITISLILWTLIPLGLLKQMGIKKDF